MESRMKKYYTEELKSNAKRTSKNAPLYRQIYGAYDEFENLKLPVSDNEIDITNLNKTVTSREEYRKMKEYGNITNTNTKVVKKELTEEAPKENKIYDINELLARAKNDVSSIKEENNYTSDYLHKLQTDEEIKTDLEKVKAMYEQLQEELVEEKEIENVTTETLSLELLSDLKSDGNTEVTPPFKESNEEENKVSTNTSEVEKKLEKTFYSDSYKFSKEDFNDDNFFDGELKKGHYALKALLVIFIVLIAVAIGLFFLDKYEIINILNR